MRRLFIVVAGVLTFALVYAVLQFSSSRPVPTVAAPATLTLPSNAVTARLDAEHVAIGLPIGGAAPLVTGLPPGTRLNILASLQDPAHGKPLTAVVARGATILQQVNGGEPMLVGVEPEDALALAHLVLGGSQLSYAVWSGGQAPIDSPPIDERTARALLGLPAPTPSPSPEPTLAPTVAPPTPTLAPSATPVPIRADPRADRYVVQPGDTLNSIADQLGIDSKRLHDANPQVPTADELPPGMQLVVPQ